MALVKLSISSLHLNSPRHPQIAFDSTQHSWNLDEMGPPYPLFVNEAAYYEKGVALVLARKMNVEVRCHHASLKFFVSYFRIHVSDGCVSNSSAVAGDVSTLPLQVEVHPSKLPLTVA